MKNVIAATLITLASTCAMADTCYDVADTARVAMTLHQSGGATRAEVIAWATDTAKDSCSKMLAEKAINTAFSRPVVVAQNHKEAVIQEYWNEALATCQK